jgi:hypothetical protein
VFYRSNGFGAACGLADNRKFRLFIEQFSEALSENCVIVND